jgi:hypothetical protein
MQGCPCLIWKSLTTRNGGAILARMPLELFDFVDQRNDGIVCLVLSVWSGAGTHFLMFRWKTVHAQRAATYGGPRHAKPLPLALKNKRNGTPIYAYWALSE